MNKVPYNTNRKYRDFDWEKEEIKPEKDILNVKKLRDLKKSRFESFKKTFRNIFKK